MSALRIGFVGPGRLGGPMVERLVAAGHDVIVHARRPEVRAALRESGITATEHLDEVARDRDLVLVCLYDDKQLTEVADVVANALPQHAVVGSHVTGAVETIRALAERHPRIQVVDAPISGTADDIRAGRLTVLTGGAPTARAMVAAAVRAYAGPVIECGGLGAALSIKLVNNLLLAANTQLLAVAAGAADSLGVSPEALLAALAHMSGGSRASSLAAEHPTLGEFATRISPFLSKDVAVCRSLADSTDVDVNLLLEVVQRGPLALA
jgi:3-hydroxyisobutyrate dehydrogenase-like beta-hydroxyacid dehydrogenase